MTINDEAWDVVTRELMIMGRVIQEKEGKDTGQSFFDAAVQAHTLFHVARHFLDTGEYLPPYKVICECEVPEI